MSIPISQDTAIAASELDDDGAAHAADAPPPIPLSNAEDDRAPAAPPNQFVGDMQDAASHGKKLLVAAWKQQMFRFAAYGIAFLLVATFLVRSCTTSPSEAISDVLKQDRQLSAQIEARSARGVEPADAVSWYATELSKIPLGDCPPDFRQAFLRHQQAWQSAASTLQNEPGVLDGLIEGFIRGLSGELDGGATRYMDARSRAGQQIQDTWYAVEEVATKHGVDMRD